MLLSKASSTLYVSFVTDFISKHWRSYRGSSTDFNNKLATLASYGGQSFSFSMEIKPASDTVCPAKYLTFPVQLLISTLRTHCTINVTVRLTTFAPPAEEPTEPTKNFMATFQGNWQQISKTNEEKILKALGNYNYVYYFTLCRVKTSMSDGFNQKEWTFKRQLNPKKRTVLKFCVFLRFLIADDFVLLGLFRHFLLRVRYR